MKRADIVSLCIIFGATINLAVSIFSGARWFEWRWIGWVGWVGISQVLSGLFFGAAAALGIEGLLAERKKGQKKKM